MSPDDGAFTLALQAQRRALRRRRRPVAVSAASDTWQPHSPTQRAGAAAEDRALQHLRQAGLRLVARNVRCKAGELDLVMVQGPVLVFVEVRARTDARYGGASASVDAAKQRRLVQAAGQFLQTRWRGAMPACRFDVVALEGEALVWLPGAFSVPT